LCDDLQGQKNGWICVKGGGETGKVDNNCMQISLFRECPRNFPELSVQVKRENLRLLPTLFKSLFSVSVSDIYRWHWTFLITFLVFRTQKITSFPNPHYYIMPKKKQISLTLVKDRVCSQHHAGGFSCDSLVGIRVVDSMTRVYLSSTRIKSESVSSIINLNTEKVSEGKSVEHVTMNSYLAKLAWMRIKRSR
jgi:hypothetical protein